MFSQLYASIGSFEATFIKVSKFVAIIMEKRSV